MDRRSFLTRASIGAALSVPTLATASHAWEPTETAEFKAAAESFFSAVDRHRSALAAKLAAVARYKATVPPVPDALIAKGHQLWPDGSRSICGIAEREVDVEGNDMWRDLPNGKCRPPRYIMSAGGLEDELRCYPARSRQAKAIRELHQLAVTHEASIEACKRESGTPEKGETLYWAAEEVQRATSRLMELEPRTPQGLATLAAAAAYPNEGLGCSWHFPPYCGARLARAITRLFGEGILQ